MNIYLELLKCYIHVCLIQWSILLLFWLLALLYTWLTFESKLFIFARSSYDFCDLLNQGFVHNNTTECPPQLRSQNLPCTCPFKAGTYTLNPATFTIPKLDSLWSWLASVSTILLYVDRYIRANFWWGLNIRKARMAHIRNFISNEMMYRLYITLYKSFYVITWISWSDNWTYTYCSAWLDLPISLCFVCVIYISC